MQDLTVVSKRVLEALNRHDIDALVDCFHPDVRSELPTQPERGYRGREQVRAYWAAILEDGADLKAKLLRCFADADTACSEWCWQGTRRDGTSFARAGVLIYGVRDERIAWMRLYMEPIQGEAQTVADWVLHELAMRPVQA